MKKSRSLANKVYKYVHNKDVWIETNLVNKEFECEFLKIDNNGIITVKGSNENGYAWDGCSPKIHFLHFVLGTPAGKLDYDTEKQMTYYAYMIHDVLYQYKDKMAISRKEADVLFKIILRDAGFLWWWHYYFAVRRFGGLYGSWKQSKSMSNLNIINKSW
jgi:hypothetical protein